MFVRGVVLFLGILLVSSGACFALEPVQTGISVTDLVIQVSQGKAVVVVPEARAVPATQAAKQANIPSGNTRTTSRPSLPPVVGMSPDGQGVRVSSFTQSTSLPRKPVNATLARERVTAAARTLSPKAVAASAKPKPKFPLVKAKAVYCVDCSSNKVVLSENSSEPLPIASITKLLTAMTALDEMKLDKIVTVPADIREVPRHRVGIRPGDLLTVRDLLHGMLIESGNDCAEALARAYPKGGREGFLAAMNRKASKIGARTAVLYTPSGLDEELTIGRKGNRGLTTRKYNQASAQDVALIARHAFRYPLIREIATMKTYTMQTRNSVPRSYPLATNDKLLSRNLPVAGAKTGFTNLAGKCIVALFRDEDKEHMVVVLNTEKHFKAAERIYRWASKAL